MKQCKDIISQAACDIYWYINIRVVDMDDIHVNLRFVLNRAVTVNVLIQVKEYSL